MAGTDTYRFTLEPYAGPASRYTCPQCGHKKRFTRYLDTVTGQHLAEHVGRCDREDRCGYHFKPRDYFVAGGERPAGDWTPPPPPPELPGYRMGSAEVQATMRQACNLTRYLGTLGGLDPDAVKHAAWEYAVGGWPKPGKYQDAAVYWQVDGEGQVRGGKVVQYDPGTGHRVKGAATWAHSLEGGIPDGFRLEQCLFGEHLLGKYPNAQVGIVEAEKTALICRIMVPSVLWVAVGGLGELKLGKLLPLAGRHVTLWPDLGKGYQEWSAKVPQLEPLFASLRVADLLERKATAADKVNGLDLADFLLRSVPSTLPTLAPASPSPSPSSSPPSPPPPQTAKPAPPPPLRAEVSALLDRFPAVGHLAEVLDLDLAGAKVRPITVT